MGLRLAKGGFIIPVHQKTAKNLVKWKNKSTFAVAIPTDAIGEMAEWSIAAVLKTVVLKGTGGSNPSLSAISLDYK